jgi:NAD(P)-dependent dehydrogenase (short-subunit alcohol dehydrogenase family)
MGGATADMRRKTCVVTGGTSGIGLETARALVERGAHVVLGCREKGRGDRACGAISAKGNGNVEVMLLDLASQRSIREFADAYRTKFGRLDVLVNNAAIVPVRRETTEDGFEMQFGVNHLGPFLLTSLLLGCLRASPAARIVTVASTVHHGATIRFDDLQSERRYKVMEAYGQSKLANVMFTYALARRLAGGSVTANCLHPGVVRTRITRDAPLFVQPLVRLAGAFMLSPVSGAQTSVFLAASDEARGFSGKYFVKCRESRSSTLSHDVAAQETLWKLSEEMTGTAP